MVKCVISMCEVLDWVLSTKTWKQMKAPIYDTHAVESPVVRGRLWFIKTAVSEKKFTQLSCLAVWLVSWALFSCVLIPESNINPSLVSRQWAQNPSLLGVISLSFIPGRVWRGDMAARWAACTSFPWAHSLLRDVRKLFFGLCRSR